MSLCVQNPHLNQKTWNNLEKLCRSLTKRYLNVYVCTGPLYLPRWPHSSSLHPWEEDLIFFVDSEFLYPKMQINDDFSSRNRILWNIVGRLTWPNRFHLDSWGSWSDLFTRSFPIIRLSSITSSNWDQLFCSSDCIFKCTYLAVYRYITFYFLKRW